MMKRVVAAVLIAIFLIALPPTAAYSEESKNLPVVSSMDELVALIREGAARLDDKIEFSYTAALDDVFSTQQGLDDMLECFGMSSWWLTRRTQYRTACVDVLSYMAGMEILYAWRTGDTSVLSAEEEKTMKKAMDVVEQALRETDSELELEKYLHDYICRTVTYGDGQYRMDGAVGVFMEGMAECDGYADAFYVLGTMAGLNVGYQSGWDTPEHTLPGHMWNVIELDGRWYHVDVCWDDMDYEQAPEMIDYRYFNVGNDYKGNHYWDGSAFDLASSTNWDKFFYTCNQDMKMDGFGVYVADAKNAAQFAISEYKAGANRAYVMVDKPGMDWSELSDEMAKLPSEASWQIWTRQLGNYTLCNVYFYR